MIPLFDRLCAHCHATPDRKGEVWVPCPFCGKDARHFSFSERGMHCFSCGAHGSLVKLSDRLGLDTGATLAPVVVAPVKPPEWQARAWEIVTEHCQHPARIARWQAYKPISAATIARHHFGLGRLPFQRRDGSWYWSRDEWLTVPLIADGQVVGLRGRNLGTQGPKWISATGTRYCLWNAENIRSGVVLWICENYVDAAWLMERKPQFDAVAIGGAANWRDEWSQQIAERQPRLVVVALDNDLAGKPHPAMYRRLLTERRREHPGLPDLVPNGPKIANSLLAVGVPAQLFRWPADAPAKADIGWLLAAAQDKRMAA